MSVRRSAGAMSAESGLLSIAQLQRVLARERARTDRNGHHFSIVVFDVQPANGDSAIEHRRLVDVLFSRLRSTDDVGWFDEGRIAAILPETPLEDAWKVAGDIRHLTDGRILHLACAAYTYPPAWWAYINIHETEGRRQKTGETPSHLARHGDTQRPNTDQRRNGAQPEARNRSVAPLGHRRAQGRSKSAGSRVQGPAPAAAAECVLRQAQHTLSLSTGVRTRQREWGWGPTSSEAGSGCQAADTANRQLSTQHPAPSTLHPDSTQHPEPITQHRTPNTQHQAPSTPHPAPRTRHPAPSTRHAAPGTPHAVDELEQRLGISLPLWKRLIDIIGAAIGLVLSAPLMLLTAVLVKATSPGPAIFTQARIGKDGSVFPLYKFRTMYVDADERKATLLALNEQTFPVFKMKSDPRVTPLGRLLRKSSVDELPQFWNVLKGDMSLVGPRPPTVDEVQAYERWHHRRLGLTPGLTCIWQVNGRSLIDFPNWVRMDIEYAERRSLWLDLQILARTIPAVLSGKGAH